MRLNILYEDQYMLACIKPVNVPSQGDKSNDEDMITQIKNYIYDNSQDDDEPYVAAIHRLDRPVGGVMIFAKNAEVAARLNDAMQDGEIVKYYQAILCGELPDMEGEMVDYIVKNPGTNTSRIAKKGDKGAKKAVLNYEVLDVMETDIGALSYVLIQLETGRHHQIRVQMAARGCAILGDTKYGKDNPANKKYKQIGLYSSRIELKHPITGEEMVFKHEPEGEVFEAIELDEF